MGKGHSYVKSGLKQHEQPNQNTVYVHKWTYK